MLRRIPVDFFARKRGLKVPGRPLREFPVNLYILLGPTPQIAVEPGRFHHRWGKGCAVPTVAHATAGLWSPATPKMALPSERGASAAPGGNASQTTSAF